MKELINAIKSNLKNETYLLWNDPANNIHELVNRKPAGYKRLVFDRDLLMQASFVNDVKTATKLLDSMTRGAFILVVENNDFQLIPVKRFGFNIRAWEVFQTEQA